MAGDLSEIVVDQLLISVKLVIFRDIPDIRKVFFLCRQGHLILQNIAYVLFHGSEMQKVREGAVRNDFLPFLAFVFFQQFCRMVQVGDFLLEMQLPHFLGPGIDFARVERPVKITFLIFP